MLPSAKHAAVAEMATTMTIDELQEQWSRDRRGHALALYTDLAECLHAYRLDMHYEECLSNIRGPKYERFIAPALFRSVEEWSVFDVQKWIASLQFLGDHADAVGRTFACEMIDGRSLMKLGEHDFRKIGLSTKEIILLSCIRRGWVSQWHAVTICPAGLSPMCAAGLAVDLSNCPLLLADALQSADEQCIQLGEGYVYGSFVTLNCKEWHLDTLGMVSAGKSNEVYTMKRRSLPNGISPLWSKPITPNTLRSISREARSITFAFQEDPSFDLYQFGRQERQSATVHNCMEPVYGNDFVVRGNIRLNQSNRPCSPVSRYACRVECSRLPPYRCFLYAAGIDESRNLALSNNALFVPDLSSQSHANQLDALTSFGTLLYSPQNQQWVEVSVKGRCFALRSAARTPGKRLPLDRFTNELVDGCVIDIYGTTFAFHIGDGASAWCKSHALSPPQMVECINNSRPQCPVMMSTLHVPFQPSAERELDAIQHNLDDGREYTLCGQVHVPDNGHISPFPITEHGDDVEDSRAYVFPACGHVNGYYRSMEGRPCPLCRKSGPCVPLSIASEPAICEGVPTHVLNPCGHALSKTACERWARVPLMMVDERIPPYKVFRPCCPVCRTTLNDVVPFSKIIMQNESGQSIQDLVEEQTTEKRHSPSAADSNLFSSISFKARFLKFPKWPSFRSTASNGH